MQSLTIIEEQDQYSWVEQFDDDVVLVDKNFDMHHMDWCCLVIVCDVHSCIYHMDCHNWAYDDVVRGDDKMVQTDSYRPNTVD